MSTGGVDLPAFKIRHPGLTLRARKNRFHCRARRMDGLQCLAFVPIDAL
jgi:hypothetical protein